MEFINGIKVLSKTQMLDYVWSNNYGVNICNILICLALAFLIFSIISRNLIGVVGTIIIIGFLFLFRDIAGTEIIKPEKYIYKVTIEDIVTFKEFNNNYEVVGQDGEIFEIRIKDDGSE